MHKSTAPRIARIVGFLVLTASVVAGQTTDEDAVKKTIRAETEAFLKCDSGAWEATWLHQTNTTRTIIYQVGYSTTTGWSNIGPAMVKALKRLKPSSLELKSENYIIRTSGNLAWVEYDQYLNLPGADPKDRIFSREYRVLTKHDGEWKIATQITTQPDTFKLTTQNIENNLNNIGYALIRAKKIKEAIEVLKVNVTLNPRSANVYDSLGEAYALDGDKGQAITNYEKSIALNPENKGGKAALAKLKE